jgi:hypothetical protein
MFRPFDFMRSATFLRRAPIRAGFADHPLLTLTMAYVAFPQAAEFFRKFGSVSDLRLNFAVDPRRPFADPAFRPVAEDWLSSR